MREVSLNTGKAVLGLAVAGPAAAAQTAAAHPENNIQSAQVVFRATQN